jgi:hypothetical protein
LTAQAYILVNHAFTDATDGGASKLRAAGVLVEGESGSVASHDESLGFAPTEIFDLFQRQRASVLRWMETHPERADGVLEEVVRVLTLNSAGSDDFHLDEREERGKTRGKKSGRASRLKATVAATLAKARGASQDKEGDKEEAGVTENVDRERDRARPHLFDPRRPAVGARPRAGRRRAVHPRVGSRGGGEGGGGADREAAGRARRGD